MFVRVDYNESFEVEADTSDYCIAATLNKQRRLVTSFSRTLNNNEIKNQPVEKEVAATVGELHEWRHFLTF